MNNKVTGKIANEIGLRVEMDRIARASLPLGARAAARAFAGLQDVRHAMGMPEASAAALAAEIGYLVAMQVYAKSLIEHIKESNPKFADVALRLEQEQEARVKAAKAQQAQQRAKAEEVEH